MGNAFGTATTEHQAYALVRALRPGLGRRGCRQKERQ